MYGVKVLQICYNLDGRNAIQEIIPIDLGNLVDVFEERFCLKKSIRSIVEGIVLSIDSSNRAIR